MAIELLRSRFSPRQYQQAICESALKRGNTLVVLPTGLGKTLIALLLIEAKSKQGRVLFLAPTKPLAEQHRKTILDSMSVPEDSVVLLTGGVSPASATSGNSPSRPTAARSPRSPPRAKSRSASWPSPARRHSRAAKLMSNDETRMTNQVRIPKSLRRSGYGSLAKADVESGSMQRPGRAGLPKAETRTGLLLWSFGLRHSFVIRASSFVIDGDPWRRP